MNQPRPWYWSTTAEYVFLYDAEDVMLFAAVKTDRTIEVAERASALANKFPDVHVDAIVDALFEDILGGNHG